MSSIISELVDDIKNLNLKKLNIGSLRDKYQLSDRKECSIKAVVDFIILNNLEDNFLDEIFYGDFRDKQIAYLLKSDKGFEVFYSERGGKHCMKIYNDYESALFDYLDRIFNEIGINAPDSEIHS